VQGAYENALLGAWFLPLIAAVVVWRSPSVARAFPAALAATVLLLGHGVMAPATLAPLEPPYRSVWLGVHVVFAWFAFGSYVVASGLAGYHLILTRAGVASPAPRAPLVDEGGAKLLAFGFVSHAVMLASGAIWAHGLWGRYWAWDPVETWSLVSWLVYGVYLHLRFTLGWSGRKASWLAVAAVATVIVTFFGIGVVSDVHTELL
jgi:ABC-type transport system involved in cytochrome c biogenesis permease subunit